MEMITLLRQDKLNALKIRHTLKADLLSVIISDSILKARVKEVSEPTDDQVLESIRKNLVANRELQQQAASRPTLLDQLIQEETILLSYLPSQLSDDELTQVIQNVLSSDNNIGAVMKHLKQNYSGRYDGKKASELVKVLVNNGKN